MLRMELKWGEIELRGTKSGSDVRAEGRWCAIAHHNGELLLVSLVASEGDAKVMRGAMNSADQVPYQIIANGINTCQPSERNNTWHGVMYPPGHVAGSRAGYEVYRHPLGFGSRHYLFVSRNPAFLLVASDEALWRELKSERFTTPLLRDWMPYIRRELERRHLIVECHAYPYEAVGEGKLGVPGLDLPLSCCCLCATSKDIDTIVVEGLKTGAIEIPGGDSRYVG
jgi:hypothetical protein